MYLVRLVAPFVRIAALAAMLAPVIADAAPPDIRLTFGDPVFTFAPACNLSQPLVYMALIVQNTGASAAPFHIDAADGTSTLVGALDGAVLAAGASVPVSVPLALSPGTSTAALPGQHVVRATVNGKSIALGFPFPPGFCPPGVGPSATPKPGGNGLQNAQIAGRVDQKGRLDHVVLRAVAAPTGLRTVASGPDCGAHVGPIGALVCPDMMKSGDMLLVWDWQPGDGVKPIDGYKIYTGNAVMVNGGDFAGQLLATHAGGDQTLFDVPKPKDGKGYAGRCYAITAYAGSRESKPSKPLCASGGEVAQTATFAPVRQASIKRQSYKREELAPENNLAKLGYAVVGYQYMAAKHIEGDSENAQISRYAMQFDVSRVAGRKIFEAHVTLDILHNSISRPDCTTSVALGTSNWWTERWPDAAVFGSPAMTVKNDKLTIDLTNPVANWAAGRFNQGIILRNDNENLNAFQNATCESYYRNPVLTVTYY